MTGFGTATTAGGFGAKPMGQASGFAGASASGFGAAPMGTTGGFGGGGGGGFAGAAGAQKPPATTMNSFAGAGAPASSGTFGNMGGLGGFVAAPKPNGFAGGSPVGFAGTATTGGFSGASPSWGGSPQQQQQLQQQQQQQQQQQLGGFAQPLGFGPQGFGKQGFGGGAAVGAPGLSPSTGVPKKAGTGNGNNAISSGPMEEVKEPSGTDAPAAAQ
jgi:hypothetical protein